MDQSQLSSRAIIGAYFARLEASPGNEWLPGVSDLFLSEQPSEKYPFLGAPPVMRELVGGRQAKALRGWEFEIANRHFEGTLEVNPKDVRRDKSGQIMLRVQEFADRSASHWASLCSALIASGDISPCYDGKNFFSPNHEEGSSGVQSNSITVDISETPAALHGIPTMPSMEEVQLAVRAAIVQMMSWKDDQGEPINEDARKFLVVVPPALVMRYMAALDPNSTAKLPQNFNVNLLKGFEVGVRMDARLTWTDKFAIFRTDGNTKALVRQSETDITMKALAEGSEHEFVNDTWHFGIDAWRNVGYGHWQRACLVRLV